MGIVSLQSPGTGRCLFILKGGFLEAPIQKLPEDTFTTVREASRKGWEKGGRRVIHQSPKVYVPL